MPPHQPYDLAHEVWVEKDSLLARLMRERLSDADTCEVNSRHHQAVKNVAPGFRVSATAPDGVIEAIEDPAARFCLGVQWHPENFWRTGEFRPLFEGFLEAAKRATKQSNRSLSRTSILNAKSYVSNHTTRLDVRRVREQIEGVDALERVAGVDAAAGRRARGSRRRTTRRRVACADGDGALRAPRATCPVRGGSTISTAGLARLRASTNASTG